MAGQQDREGFKVIKLPDAGPAQMLRKGGARYSALITPNVVASVEEERRNRARVRADRRRRRELLKAIAVTTFVAEATRPDREKATRKKNNRNRAARRFRARQAKRDAKQE